MVIPAIEQSRNLSFQDRATTDTIWNNVHVVHWLSHGSETVAPWWSTLRDRQLRAFWKESDHLSGAIYTMTSKMTAIPNKVVARDPTIKKFAKQASVTSEVLHGASEFGDGWVTFYAKFVEDLLTQDNGAFAEVIGKGNPAGPVIGQPVSVAHMDSYRCTRTGNAEFPVIYTDQDGKLYKLHYTRVMYTSQMTSPISEMFGVGFCAVSRCINIAQNLIDIVVYKMEKLGSRPHRQVIITKGGLDPADLRLAFQVAEGAMDSQSLSRYSKVVVGGSSTLPEADVSTIDLAGLPDGFDEETSIIYGMATIALALGMDARELFPAMSAGATRADALLQHLKQRGKGPGQILQVTEQLFDYKFLPSHLRFQFDFQDDAQDRQVAEIQEVRAKKRVQDTTTGAITDRIMREQMLNDGDINESQFARMELDSGRLVDGTASVALFYVKGKPVSKYLDLGVADPLDIDANDQMKVLSAIQEQRAAVMEDMVNAVSEETKWVTRQAKSALDQLEARYRQPEIWVKWDEVPPKPMPIANNMNDNPNADQMAQNNNRNDPRQRRVNLTNPQPEEETNTGGSLTRQHPDDKPE